MMLEDKLCKKSLQEGVLEESLTASPDSIESARNLFDNPKYDGLVTQARASEIVRMAYIIEHSGDFESMPSVHKEDIPLKQVCEYALNLGISPKSVFRAAEECIISEERICRDFRENNGTMTIAALLKTIQNSLLSALGNKYPLRKYSIHYDKEEHLEQYLSVIRRRHMIDFYEIKPYKSKRLFGGEKTRYRRDYVARVKLYFDSFNEGSKELTASFDVKRIQAFLHDPQYSIFFNSRLKELCPKLGLVILPPAISYPLDDKYL